MLEFRADLERRRCRIANDLLRAATAFPEAFQELCEAYGYDHGELLGGLREAIPSAKEAIHYNLAGPSGLGVRVWLIGR